MMMAGRFIGGLGVGQLVGVLLKCINLGNCVDTDILGCSGSM